jgi:hypothetical protein
MCISPYLPAWFFFGMKQVTKSMTEIDRQRQRPVKQSFPGIFTKPSELDSESEVGK